MFSCYETRAIDTSASRASGCCGFFGFSHRSIELTPEIRAGLISRFEEMKRSKSELKYLQLEAQSTTLLLFLSQFFNHRAITAFSIRRTPPIINTMVNLAYVYRGYAYFHQRKFDLASKNYGTLLELYGTHHHALWMRALCFESKGDQRSLLKAKELFSQLRLSDHKINIQINSTTSLSLEHATQSYYYDKIQGCIFKNAFGENEIYPFQNTKAQRQLQERINTRLAEGSLTMSLSDMVRFFQLPRSLIEQYEYNANQKIQEINDRLHIGRIPQRPNTRGRNIHPIHPSEIELEQPLAIPTYVGSGIEITDRPRGGSIHLSTPNGPGDY